MRKSITSKIIISYIVIVCASLIIVGILFNFAARRYMERQAIQTLRDDAMIIADVFKKEIKNDNETDQSKIKQMIREKMKSIKTLDCSFAVIAKNMSVIYPKVGAESLKFKTDVLPKIKIRIALIKGNKNADTVVSKTFRIVLDGQENVVIVYPLNSKLMGSTSNGWVVLYTPIGPIKKLQSSMAYILLYSLIFAGFIAVLTGVFFARSIARPIILLKNRAEALAKRDFDSRVDIYKGDEIGELANTINNMAEELKEYDSAQKRFLQNASHELKTPLMSIQGYAEGIKDGVFGDKDEALDIIVEESTRLKAIVEELIFLSKLETMEDFYKYGENCLNSIIDGSIEKIRGLAVKKNIYINKESVADIKIYVDKDKLIQAFINLLGNCVKYARSRITVSALDQNNSVTIIINDDGEGFDEKDIGKVFDRFYKGKKGGTGLGLAITKTIIEKHGGTIIASNGKNGGAEFKIILPVRHDS